MKRAVISTFLTLSCPRMLCCERTAATTDRRREGLLSVTETLFALRGTQLPRPRCTGGDTHLHTGNSLDAGAFGARLTPGRCASFRAWRRADVVDGPKSQAVSSA